MTTTVATGQLMLKLEEHAVLLTGLAAGLLAGSHDRRGSHTRGSAGPGLTRTTAALSLRLPVGARSTSSPSARPEVMTTSPRRSSRSPKVTLTFLSWLPAIFQTRRCRPGAGPSLPPAPARDGRRSRHGLRRTGRPPAAPWPAGRSWRSARPGGWWHWQRRRCAPTCRVLDIAKAIDTEGDRLADLEFTQPVGRDLTLEAHGGGVDDLDQFAADLDGVANRDLAR